jgi:glycosyltransferase involved in cell wall biosynthesis
MMDSAAAPAVEQEVSGGAANEPVPEITVVMPCLNEAATLGSCIQRAQEVFASCHLRGEIVIADNGSTDASRQLASTLGARVVHADRRGYGHALRQGILAARSPYVVMGDADGSYDFAQVPVFLGQLQSGADLVMGNRFAGAIHTGAMRPLHRYFGVPLLSSIARLLFDSPIHDNHCGLRAVRKSAFLKMDLRGGGWEFGSEMILKANLLGMRVKEVPVTLSLDGRDGPSHLRTWEAGWKHLRLMLIYSPRWLFLYPGLLLMLAGLALGIWLAWAPRTIGGVTFNVHTLLYAAAAIVLGFQAASYATFAKVFGIHAGLFPADPRLDRLLKLSSFERGVAVGFLLVFAGLAGSAAAVGSWTSVHFGPLDTSRTMRIAIPSVVCLILGSQVMLSSLLLTVMAFGRRQRED